MNTSRVELALMNAYGMAPEGAVELVFHLNDILPDLKRLVATLDNTEALSDDEVVDFEYGIKVEPRQPGPPGHQ